MDRLFLDANVLFSAAYKVDTRLFELWNLTNVTLCSSRYALEEARLNLSEGEQQRRLNRLSETVHLFGAAQRELPHGILLPEKDAPIILAAIEAQCTHLLTGDARHFGPYFGKKIEGVSIVPPGEYLRNRKA